MQLTSLLLLVGLLQVSAESFSQQRITLSEHQVSLKRVFKELRKQSGYDFIYSNSVLNKATPVTIDLKNVSLEDAVEQCLKGQPLTYAIVDRTVVISIKKEAYTTIRLPDSSLKITGHVTDENNNALIGVSVSLKETQRGAITDANGDYTLTIPNDNGTLVFSYVGYSKQEIPIKGRIEINVVLKANVSSLNQLVVVGYGKQKKSSLTSAVSDIQGEDLSMRPVANTSQALQGLAPGVTVIDRGGYPGGSNATIRIRGITTLSGNDPLILVDGIEQSLQDINPDDIESITVLKDAASTAIYGSRAANGVILVTTKRAKAGKLSVNLHSYYAIQKTTFLPKQIGMRDYMEMQNVAYENAGLPAPFTQDKINTWVNATDRIKYPLVNDWVDVMFSPAPQQSHTLSVEGGNDKARALLSVNYFYQDGIIPNSSSDQRNIRLNTNFNLSERIKLSADFNYKLKNYKEPTQNVTAIKYIWASSNFAVPRYPDGTYGLSSDGISPLVQAELRGISHFKDNFGMINLKADISLLKGLNFQTQYGLTIEGTQQKIYNNKYEIRDYYNPDVILQQVKTNSLTEGRDYYEQYTLNNLLTYNLTINDHSLNALLGYSQISYNSNYLSAIRKDFYNNEVQAISQGSLDSRDNDGADAAWGLRSYFGRLNYNYKEKYFIEINARYDGSSRFTGNNRYSFFPSFSGAWRISKEPFWENLLKVINELKIRGSWGEAGNQTVGLYSYLETLSARNYDFGGESVQGLYQSLLANKNISWETTTQMDMGLDALFWKGRLGISFDYYRKMTDGILLYLPIPLVVGLNAPPQNAGSVKNNGWEAAFSYRGGANSDFHYNFSFNISNVNNKIVNLAGTGPYISQANWVTTVQKVGFPIDEYLGYKTDGLFQSQEEVDKSILLYPNVGPGDIKYVDVNKDGILNSSDMVPIGSNIPHYTFGLNMNFGYKNFDLSLFLQGVGKCDFMVGEWAGNVAWQSFVMDFQKDYWTPENKDAEYPRPVAFADNNWVNSDFWIVNSAYLKLKNIQVGYSLPANITKRFNIQRLRIYLSLSNLFSISKINKWGFDPEIGNSMRDYPQVSLRTIGIDLRF